MKHPLEIGANVGVDVIFGEELIGAKATVLNNCYAIDSENYLYYLEVYVGEDPYPRLWFDQDSLFPLIFLA